MATAKASKDPSKSTVPVSNTGDGKSCVVSKGTKIEGNFQSNENIRLDGSVEGDLFCDKKLVLGEGGQVTGNVSAQDAVIMGKIEGDLSIAGLLTLESTSIVLGNIQAGRIQVQEGARYEGTCQIGGKN